MSEEKHTYADKFVYFWIAFLLVLMWCMVLELDNVMVGLGIALLLTTPLRHRWL